MIYLFDKNKKLNKALSLNHFNSAHQVKIINGSYTVDLVTPLKFTKRGTVYNHKKAFDKAVFVGHFDENDEFQLYKIRNISVDNNSLNIIGIHIFFDEAKAKTIIHDRRWRDSELRPIADFALGEIGWNLIECDVTDRYNFNIFRGSVLDFRNDAVDTYKVEMDYVIGFDGQQITSKGVRIKKRLGEETGQRFAYGSNVLKIKAEEERSEVYSAILGRGRGEESGDGFGQRIEFGDVVWSTANGDPVNKPAGQNYVELTSATDKYGYHEADGTVHPRIAVIEFDDIEDTGLLIQESWEWLLQNSVPKAVFESEVFALGNFKLGDSIGIIYKDAGIVKKARVHKVDRNLHDNRKTSFELGDYKHFKPNSINDVRKELKKQKRSTSEWITRLKTMFDADFEHVVGEINDSYANAVAEAEAKVQASEAKMNEVISGQRDALEQEINTAKQSAIDEATLNAETKAQTVQSNLDTFKDDHQQLYNDVTTEIIDINDFLGEKDFSLDWHLNSLREEMQERINAVNTSNPNMLVGTTLEHADDFTGWFDTVVELRTDETLNYIRFSSVDGTSIGYRYPEPVRMVNGQVYTLALDFRSDVVNDLDYTYFLRSSAIGNVGLTTLADVRGLTADGQWHRYYFTFTWTHETSEADVMIGTSFNYGDTDRGHVDTRQVMLYEGDAEVPWKPSPSDNRQVITQLTREINELEDGLKARATKTEFDLLSQDYTQFTNEFTTTAERLESQLQEHDNWLDSNGSNLLQMADRVQSKVWLNDVSEIGANIIPFADVSNSDNLDRWSFWNANANAVDSRGYYVVRSTDSTGTIGIQSTVFNLKEGETYTLSYYADSGEELRTTMDYTFIMNPNGSNSIIYMDAKLIDSATGERFYWKTFEAKWSGEARILIGSRLRNGVPEGSDVSFRFKEPKLEKGSEPTPFMNSVSQVEQLANEIDAQVQALDGDVVKQSGVEIQSDRVLIGSTSIGSSTLASIISVSPSAVDIITDKLNLTGNLNVKGQIETISLDAIDANFSRVQTAILKADVIENMHLSSNSVEVDNIRMTHALAEKIMANTVMANEVKAMSVNAVYADLRSVNSEIMTSNVIKSSWLDVDTALFNRFTASSAFISSLTAKTAFIRDIQAIEINTSQLNVDTIMEQGGNIAGGISIRRPDGAYAVNNGMLRNEYVVNAYNPNFMTATSQGLNAFYQSGEWWVTSRRVRQDAGKLRFNAYQFVHSARYLEIEIGYRRHQTDVFFEINSFGSYSFNQTYSQFQSGGGSTEYHVMKVDLGVPDYKRKSFYFYAYPNSTGDESDEMWFRILRVVQTDF